MRRTLQVLAGLLLSGCATVGDFVPEQRLPDTTLRFDDFIAPRSLTTGLMIDRRFAKPICDWKEVDSTAALRSKSRPGMPFSTAEIAYLEESFLRTFDGLLSTAFEASFVEINPTPEILALTLERPLRISSECEHRLLTIPDIDPAVLDGIVFVNVIVRTMDRSSLWDINRFLNSIFELYEYDSNSGVLLVKLPWEISAEAVQQYSRVVSTLSERTSLAGGWYLDFVVNATNTRPVFLEIEDGPRQGMLDGWVHSEDGRIPARFEQRYFDGEVRLIITKLGGAPFFDTDSKIIHLDRYGSDILEGMVISSDPESNVRLRFIRDRENANSIHN